MSVLYLAAAIVLEICGTTSLKLSRGLPASSGGAVVVCYAASFALLSVALRGSTCRSPMPSGPASAPQSSR